MVRKKITLNEAQLKRIISEAVMTAMQGQMPHHRPQHKLYERLQE